MSQDIMTPVLIEPLRQVAQRDPRAESAIDFVASTHDSLGLRPSIETSVHAVIPSTVVEATIVGDRLRVQSNHGRPAAMLVLPDIGVLLHRSAPSGADAVARCLADVVARIPDDAPVSTLTAAQEQDLAYWEAEAYRQSMNSRAVAT